MFERILIVDDDPDAARYARAMLEQQGYEVEVAASGRQALDRVGLGRPDLVLLDLQMPGLNGFAVLQALKSSPALKGIPVVVLSAKRGSDDVARAIEGGAADYVAKPINAGMLAAKVRSVLVARHADRQPQEQMIGLAQYATSGGASVRIRGQLEAVSEDEAMFFSRLCFEPGQTVELSVAALGPLANKDRVLRIVSRSPQVREGHPGYLYRLAPVEQPETEMQHGF